MGKADAYSRADRAIRDDVLDDILWFDHDLRFWLCGRMGWNTPNS
jgi:hypothetical protein